MMEETTIIGTVRLLRYSLRTHRWDRPEGSSPRELVETVEVSNLVTQAGKRWYAKTGLVPAATLDSFNAMVLFSGAATPTELDTLGSCGVQVPGSLKRIVTGAARVLDGPTATNPDAGPGVRTYEVAYGSAEANAPDISGVCLTNYADGAPGNTEPILMHARFPSITKGPTDELVVVVNHRFA